MKCDCGMEWSVDKYGENCPMCNQWPTSPSLLGVRLRWQTEPPKVAGWYWIKFNGKTSVREFDQPVIDQLGEEETKPEYKELASRGNFFWAGPIPEPEEAT